MSNEAYQPRLRLLFVDTRLDWLQYIESSLSDVYDITISHDFRDLSMIGDEERKFDFIFFTLDQPRNGFETIENNGTENGLWSFLVLYPGFSKEEPLSYKTSIVDVGNAEMRYGKAGLKRLILEETRSVRRQLIPSTQRKVFARLPLEREFQEFGESEKIRLIGTIARYTRTLINEIEIIYTLPGSVYVTLEMAEESALELMRQYLQGSPFIRELGISSVELRPATLHVNNQQKLTDKFTHSDILIDYKLGLERMGGLMLNLDQKLQNEFHTLEARLLDYLRDERLFGSNETIREGKARVINSLNELASTACLDKSFTQLCKQMR